MFSFHKPKVYRSSEGCCICRAKTSSSRFIESKKYEKDAMKCFLLDHPRKGEICNACVLLVKRFKRLPVGSNKNWGHVVDARAGGTTTKVSKTPLTTASVSNINSSASSNSSATGKGSLLPEKFAKIFKKTKKSSKSSSHSAKSGGGESGSAMGAHSKKSSRVTSAGHNCEINNHSIPASLPGAGESDCEDSQYAVPSSSLQNGNIVEFQTETRASYRARKTSSASSLKTEALTSSNAHGRRRPLTKMGCKRRKCFMPRKRLKFWDEEEYKKDFFDSNDWLSKKTCCGIIYESSKFNQAILLKTDEFKPCLEHSLKKETSTVQVKRETAIVTGVQRPLTSAPSVVQIQLPTNVTQNQVQIQINQASSALLPPPPPQTQQHHPHQPMHSHQPHSIPQPQPAVNVSKPTPVLKKHHLFFKRQSESFPHGDINVNHNSNSATTTAAITPIKNEISVPVSNVPPVKIETATYPPTSTIVFSSSSSSTSVTATSSPSAINPATYMPRHSSAKVTTISTSHSSSPQIPINSTAPTYTPHLSKSQQMLHKVKPESGGKIYKQHSSLDKVNSTVRIKPSDLQDMKHVIKTVDKSYVLGKPSTTITPINNNTNSNNNNSMGPGGHMQYHQALSAAVATTISTGASSPSSVSSTSSSSSSSSTKYSDNSSDSGFDENMLDRKSASPLQEDTERKILTRPGLQTMFLSSGVQIQGQHQNIVLTGNEVAAKVMQNRKASTITVTPANSNGSKMSTNSATMMHHHHQPHLNNNRPATSLGSGSTSGVKIAQIIGTNSMQNSNSIQTTISGGSHVAKMRAIYNNNTIQHENGITTIVPASSLAATSQTAAMNAIPPNTVTITPAPLQHGGKKIISNNTTATITAANYPNQHIQNIIAANSPSTTINPVLSSYNIHQQHHQQQQQQQQQQQSQHLHQAANANHQISGNQKIILLKTSTGGTLGGPTTTTKYNTNAIINNNTQNLINKGLLTSNNIQTVNVPSTTITTAQINSLNIQTTTHPQASIIKSRP